MRLNDHEHDDKHNLTWVAIGPGALAAALMLVVCVATVLLMNLEALRPKVGDLIVFRPTTQAQDMWQIQVQAYRPTALGRVACVLDPAVIVEHGGSLIVEARDDAHPDQQYRLHWAGMHSANGQGDCSGSAELTVSRTDLQKLANAAGGFGINHGLMR